MVSKRNTDYSKCLVGVKAKPEFQHKLEDFVRIKCVTLLKNWHRLDL